MARKKRYIKKNTTKQDLLKKVKKQAIETNKRLLKLEKGYDVNRAVRNPKTGRYERPSKEVKRVSFKSGTWASKRLTNKLDTNKLPGVITTSNRVKIPRNLNITQLTAIQKSLSLFLNSMTSTPKGIQEVREKTKDTLREMLELEDENLTDNELDDYYEMFGDSDIKDITELIGGSEPVVQGLVIDARDNIEDKNNKKVFVNNLMNLANSNDKEISRKASNLYDKWVLKK